MPVVSSDDAPRGVPTAARTTLTLTMDIEAFLFVEPPGRAIAILGEHTCPFVERACREHQTEDQLAA